MRPVHEGDRGPAVEDIQRRLLVLDHDLGPTGVDGVFLGKTVAAVREFQRAAQVAEDGVVGSETWAALVDATFTLGDRLLYLRFPYLHGRDVSTLQSVLCTLGFACGDQDGIFGTFTERAVREFQLNVGLIPDGIAGAETIKAIDGLRHVWQGRDAIPGVIGSSAPARAAHALSGRRVIVRWIDEAGRAVAERLANLATAAEPEACVEALPAAVVTTGPAEVLLVVGAGGEGANAGQAGIPVVAAHAESDPTLAARVMTALRAGGDGGGGVVVELARTDADEHWTQAVAVGLLDGLCASVT